MSVPEPDLPGDPTPEERAALKQAALDVFIRSAKEGMTFAECLAIVYVAGASMAVKYEAEIREGMESKSCPH